MLLAGCMNLPPRFPTAAGTVGPRPMTVAAAAPELRIPSDAVAAAPQQQEVPLVPVPPVPIGRGDDRPRNPAPAAAATEAAPAVVPAVAKTPAPATPPAASPRALYQQAAERYASMDSYIARLTRREQVNGKNQPEEVILFKFRKDPWSVSFKWLGETGKGREVVYVKGQHGDQIHTLLAAGDHPFKPAGSRVALACDSVFVRMASRHPITEAGIGASIERLGRLLDAVDRGDTSRGTVHELGPQKRPEFADPIPCIEHVIPPGAEATLPRGGRRLYGFDPENHLPVLVVTRDDKGQEAEYYRYDHLMYPVRLDAQDFDPDRLWGKPVARPAAAP
jgi:hypothetical protein